MDLALTMIATADNPNVGDLDIQGNSFYVVDDEQAIMQDIFVTLQWFYGEWFLDARAGIPYYEKVLTKNPNRRQVSNILRRAILSRPGIAEIITFDLNYDPATRSARPRFIGRFSTGKRFDSADYAAFVMGVNT